MDFVARKDHRHLEISRRDCKGHGLCLFVLIKVSASGLNFNKSKPLIANRPDHDAGMVSVTFDHRLESGIQSMIRQGPTSPRRAKQPKPDLLETSTPGTLNSTIQTLHLHPEMHDASRFCFQRDGSPGPRVEENCPAWWRGLFTIGGLWPIEYIAWRNEIKTVQDCKHHHGRMIFGIVMTNSTLRMTFTQRILGPYILVYRYLIRGWD